MQHDAISDTAGLDDVTTNMVHRYTPRVAHTTVLDGHTFVSFHLDTANGDKTLVLGDHRTVRRPGWSISQAHLTTFSHPPHPKEANNSLQPEPASGAKPR